MPTIPKSVKKMLAEQKKFFFGEGSSRQSSGAASAGAGYSAADPNQDGVEAEHAKLQAGYAEFLGKQLDDPSLCTVACDALGAMGRLGDPYAPKMAKCLDSEDAGLRRSAAKALGRTGPGGLQHLMQALSNDKAVVREAAVFELGAQNATQHIMQVAKLLTDSDASVRNAAVTSMAKMGEAGYKYANEGGDLVGDSDVEVQKAATEFVKLVTGLATEEGEEEKKGAKAKELEAMKSQNAAVLCRNKQAPARLLALKALMERKALAAHIEAAAFLAGDENEEVREMAAKAVGQVLKEDASVAVKLLTHSNEGARRVAVERVGSLGKEAAKHVDEVAKMLTEDNPVSRLNALIFLGNMGEQAEKHVSAIAKLTKDKDPKVRAAAATALGQLGEAGKKHAKDLLDLGKVDTDPDVRTAVSEALRQMGAF